MGERLLTYFVITAGYSGAMAVFADDGRLVGWTDHIKSASLFLSHDAARQAVQSICRPEYERAVRCGRASKEVDEELGEVVYMDVRGDKARPMRTPGITMDTAPRSLDERPEPDQVGSRFAVRDFVKAEFRQARRNPTRQTEALIQPRDSSGSDYRMPISERAKRARAYGGFVRPAA